MCALAFDKYEGLGNDFVLLEADVASLSREQVVAICDRHRGVGADGVLFVTPVGESFHMHVVNADGSDAEMCGNGLRCVALHLARRGLIAVGAEVVLDTDAGPHPSTVLSLEGAPSLGGAPSLEGAQGEVRIAMRAASLEPEDVPLAGSAPMVELPLAALGHTVHVTAVSMGNPHAVLFDDVGDARVALGPVIQDDARFPKKANVGFAQMHASETPTGMTLHVYERGSGWTEACGTGACAAAVAAVETGRAARGAPIAVHLPGGALQVVVRARGARVEMTGPARHVFAGVL